MINESNIPSDWKIFRLSELANVQMGQSPDGETYNSHGEGVPFVQGNADLGEKNPIVRIYTTNPKKFSEPEEILLTVRAPVGAMNINDKHIAIGRGIAAISEFDKTNYLFHYLNHNQWLMQRLEQGTTFTEINQREIRRLHIAAPVSPEERKEISNTISKADDAIAVMKASIAKAERLKKSLMQNLLTGKLKTDGNWRKENEFYKDEKFGNVPIGWKVKRLDEVFFVNQETLSSKTKPDYTFNYITIESAFTERIEWSLVSKEIFKNAPSRARRIIKEGDILLSTVRPNLKSFLIFKKPIDFKDDWICSTGFGVLTAKENQDKDFYFFQILSEIGEKQFYSFVAGTNYPAINDRDFKRILFYEAPFPEQKIIGEKISKVSDFISSKHTKIKKLERLKKALMQNLLTGKVRVKIKAEQTA